MSRLQIAKTAYSRHDAQFPLIRCENYYSEPSPITKGGEVWIPRAGLELFMSGSGTLRGLYRENGVLNGDLIRVANDRVQRIEQDGTLSDLGGVSGDGFVSIAGSLAGIMVADGETLQYSTGGALTTITLPFAKPVWVGFVSGYWVCVSGETYKRYWTQDADYATWEALNFDAASTKADNLICSAIVGGRIWDFGQNSVEFRYPSGDVDSPFVVETGRSYERGCLTKDSVVAIDNSCIWVGDDKIIYRGGEVPQAISSPFITEKLNNVLVSEIYSCGFSWQGHVFYCITIGSQGTFVYDLTNQSWAEWKTYNKSNWLAGFAVVGWDSKPIFANVETGDLYQMNSDIFTDDGLQLVGLLSAFTLIPDGRPSINNIKIDVATGFNLNTGLGSEPILDLRLSKDGGQTWGDWISLNMGKQGQYNWRVIHRRLGQFKSPMFMCEIRISDPIPRRISSIELGVEF